MIFIDVTVLLEMAYFKFSLKFLFELWFLLLDSPLCKGVVQLFPIKLLCESSSISFLKSEYLSIFISVRKTYEKLLPRAKIS